MSLENNIGTLAKSYIMIFADDAIRIVRDDISCAIGLREWNKTHILYSVQTQIRRMQQTKEACAFISADTAH